MESRRRPWRSALLNGRFMCQRPCLSGTSNLSAGEPRRGVGSRLLAMRMRGCRDRSFAQAVLKAPRHPARTCWVVMRRRQLATSPGLPAEAIYRRPRWSKSRLCGLKRQVERAPGAVPVGRSRLFHPAGLQHPHVVISRQSSSARPTAELMNAPGLWVEPG